MLSDCALFPDCCFWWSKWGRASVLIQMASYHNRIILFWTRAPRTLAGQVAASYFHSTSRVAPVCLLID